MRIPGSVPLALAVLAHLAPMRSLAAQSPARWTVDATPILTLGESQADTNDMFSRVVGATRLPDGRVLVGDLGSYALRLFSPDGNMIRQFGRKGAGPGEIGYLANLLRCGDSLVTLDIEAQRLALGSSLRVLQQHGRPDGVPQPPTVSRRASPLMPPTGPARPCRIRLENPIRKARATLLRASQAAHHLAARGALPVSPYERPRSARG